MGASLGLIVTAGVIQGIYSQKQTYYAQSASLSLYENGRYSMHILKKIISNSGFLGCFNGTPNNAIDTAARLNDLATYTQGVLGYSGTGSSFSPSLPSYLNGISIDNSNDVIVLEALSTLTKHPLQAMNSEDDVIEVSDSISPDDGDVLMISDCENADLFRVSHTEEKGQQVTLSFDATYNTQNGKFTNNAKLSKAYGLSAHIGQYTKQALYLSENQNGNSALWLSWLSSNGRMQTEELIEGVEKLNILYGIDTTNDGSANVYLDAKNISNWQNVVSVRLYLLINSVTKMSLDESTYSYRGQKFSATDGLARQEFSTTIKLSNKGLS